MTTTYQLPMFERLKHRTTWNGGMLAGSDVVTLEEAARFASKHAGVEITSADFLRAAGRGQIPMRAICPRAVRMEPCRETDQVLTMPENCIPTLPLDACRALSSTGRAEWRTLDGYEKVEIFGDVLGRFTRWQLPDTESDILTTPDDCRVTGWDVHALADAFIDKPAPPVAGVASSKPNSDRKASSNWKMQIQVEAAALVLRLRASGANPTTRSIIDPMAKWCVANNVKTDSGIHPSANYLRTHVLGGKHWNLPN